MNLMFLAVFVAFVANSLAQKNEICYDFPFEDGSGSFTCYAVLPRWSYVSVFNGCADFTYGGCGGNENNFHSKKECEDTCVE